MAAPVLINMMVESLVTPFYKFNEEVGILLEIFCLYDKGKTLRLLGHLLTMSCRTIDHY